MVGVHDHAHVVVDDAETWGGDTVGAAVERGRTVGQDLEAVDADLGGGLVGDLDGVGAVGQSGLLEDGLLGLQRAAGAQLHGDGRPPVDRHVHAALAARGPGQVLHSGADEGVGDRGACLGGGLVGVLVVAGAVRGLVVPGAVERELAVVDDRLVRGVGPAVRQLEPVVDAVDLRDDAGIPVGPAAVDDVVRIDAELGLGMRTGVLEELGEVAAALVAEGEVVDRPLVDQRAAVDLVQHVGGDAVEELPLVLLPEVLVATLPLAVGVADVEGRRVAAGVVDGPVLLVGEGGRGVVERGDLELSGDAAPVDRVDQRGEGAGVAGAVRYGPGRVEAA